MQLIKHETSIDRNFLFQKYPSLIAKNIEHASAKTDKNMRTVQETRLQRKIACKKKFYAESLLTKY